MSSKKVRERVEMLHRVPGGDIAMSTLHLLSRNLMVSTFSPSVLDVMSMHHRTSVLFQV